MLGLFRGDQSKQDDRKGLQSNDEADDGILPRSGHLKNEIAIWSELRLVVERDG